MLNLKLAIRTLTKTPFVTLVAVLSLSLGIGANSAMFSLFDQFLLRPLPVQAPEELVNLRAPGPKQGNTTCNLAGDCQEIFSYPMFLDLEKEQKALTGLAGHRIFGANIAYDGQTTSTEGVYVTGQYFSTLGLKPARGRLLDSRDLEVVGEGRVAVLSHGAWVRRFGADPDVLNKPLKVNGETLTIVGIAPEGFASTTLGSRPTVYVPMTMRGVLSRFNGYEDRQDYWIYAFGRLRPEVSREQAAIGLTTLFQRIRNEVEKPLQDEMSEDTLAQFLGGEIILNPGAQGQSDFNREAEAPLILLFGVAGVVLLIACANVANLLLARSAGRTTEMAVRLSIGAGRTRLIRQLLLESTLLALLGGLGGIIAAKWTLVVMSRMLPTEVTSYLHLGLDARGLVFAGFVALGTGFLFGLFPALHSTRMDLATTLRRQSGQQSGSRLAARFRTALVVAQIALSTTLLVSAALLTRSLNNVSRVDLGQNIENMVTFSISPGVSGYTPERSMDLHKKVEEELAAIPGVTGVTASLVATLAGNSWGRNVSVQGFEADLDTDTNSRYNAVGPGYFSTMGVPLIAGREFKPSDAGEGQQVVIVNESFAEKFNLDRDAIGKFMADERTEELDMEIVGLVKNATYSHVKSEVPPLFFQPYRQRTNNSTMNFYVRSDVSTDTIMSAIPGVLRALDPNLPVDNLKTMIQQKHENVFVDRSITTMSAAFAVLATILAAIGLYGVLAFTVAQRTREIGLRMALGADGPRVRHMVLMQMGRMALIGGVLGILGAIGIGQLMGSLLYDVQGHDPFAMLAAVAMLSVVACGAALGPAMRAAGVDPMWALRYE